MSVNKACTEEHSAAQRRKCLSKKHAERRCQRVHTLHQTHAELVILSYHKHAERKRETLVCIRKTAARHKRGE